MIVFCYNSVTVKVDVSEYQQFALEEMAEITELISIYLYCYVLIGTIMGVHSTCFAKVNKRQGIPKGQTKIDKPKKPDNIGYTRRRKTKQEHNTICVGHHYAQTNTNNINKK